MTGPRQMSRHDWIETRERTSKERVSVTAVCSCGWDVECLKERGWLTRVRKAFKYHKQHPFGGECAPSPPDTP